MPQSTTIEMRRIICKFIHLLDGHDSIALCAMSSTNKRVNIFITDMYHSAFRDGFAWHRRVHSSTSVSTRCSYVYDINHKVLASGEGDA